MDSPIAQSGRRPTRRRKPAGRTVYPLDITGLGELLKAARQRTGIKNKAELLRLSIKRGLPILEKQLASHLPKDGSGAAATMVR